MTNYTNHHDSRIALYYFAPCSFLTFLYSQQQQKQQWGVPQIHVMAAIASKAGIQQLVDAHPDVYITVGMVDDVGDDGRLQPGLGDSGDRLFGTAPATEDEESLLHPSRRKRAMSQSLEE